MSGGHLQRTVVRKTVYDKSPTVNAGAQTLHSESLELPGGIANSLLAEIHVQPSTVDASSQCVLAMETQLPSGEWHQVMRLARITGQTTTVANGVHKIWRLTQLAARSDVSDRDRSLAITDTAEVKSQFLVVGPVRARFIINRGSLSAQTWAIRVDLVLGGVPGVIT